ncbi:MAG: tail fiber domain-containing protein [Flavobacteriales bacterium]|nr:tail fiber domain-containing protein [Flavobacteriales bacterium]
MARFHFLFKHSIAVVVTAVFSLPFLSIAQQGMKVGATTAPAEMLDVNGAIKIGTDFTNTTGAPLGGAGTIRFKSGQYEGWDGAAWIPLGGGSGADTDWTIVGNDQYSGVSGNVGIGNNTPTYRLDVKGLGTAQGISIQDNIIARFEQSTISNGMGIAIKGYRGTAGRTSSFIDLMNFDGTSNYILGRVVGERGTSYQGSLVFYTNSGSSATNLTEKMRISDSGNVGIGITNPTYKLHVNGKIRTNAINETSDGRLKKDIKTISNASNLVKAIDGVTYYWRTDEFPNMQLEERLQYGVIAQEIEKIVPELVNTDSEGWKSVEYTHLVPILLEALKEQMETIDKLTDQNEQFSASLDALSAQATRNSEFIELIISKGLLDGVEEAKAAINSSQVENR